jgi:hypothetical protein
VILRGQVLKLAQLVGQNPTMQQMNGAIDSCELNGKSEFTLDECYALIWSIWYNIFIFPILLIILFNLLIKV